jgi:hypothetical protein
MDEPGRGRLSLWVLLAVLGVATVVGEVALSAFGLGSYSLAVLPVTAGIGMVYLIATSPREPRKEDEEEPFDDPVEEALAHPPSDPPVLAEPMAREGGSGLAPSSVEPESSADVRSGGA